MANKKSNKVSISLRIPADLSKQLDKTVAAENSTKSTIIITALSQFLSREDDMGILWRDLRRVSDKVDESRESADLGVEFIIKFAKDFYRFIEIYQQDHNREFKKETAHEKFLENVMDKMLTEPLFSEDLKHERNRILNN